MAAWRISSNKRTPPSSMNGNSIDAEFIWVNKEDLAAAAAETENIKGQTPPGPLKSSEPEKVKEIAPVGVSKGEFLKSRDQPEKMNGQTLKKTEYVKKSSSPAVLPPQAAATNSKITRKDCSLNEWSPVLEGIVPLTPFHTTVLGIDKERLASNVEDCINDVLYGGGKSRFL